MDRPLGLAITTSAGFPATSKAPASCEEEVPTTSLTIRLADSRKLGLALMGPI